MSFLKWFGPLSLLTVLVFAPCVAHAQSLPPPFAFSWASQWLTDIAVAPSGDLYIASTFLNRVQKTKRDGNVLFEITRAFDMSMNANGLEIDASGNLFVVRTGPATMGRLLRFTSEGVPVWRRNLLAQIHG